MVVGIPEYVDAEGKLVVKVWQGFQKTRDVSQFPQKWGKVTNNSEGKRNTDVSKAQNFERQDKQNCSLIGTRAQK